MLKLETAAILGLLIYALGLYNGAAIGRGVARQAAWDRLQASEMTDTDCDRYDAEIGAMEASWKN